MGELMNEITPLPWRENSNGTRVIAGEPSPDTNHQGFAIVADAESKMAALAFNQIDPDTRLANIRYIVRACNSYPTLMGFCRKFVDLLELHGLYGEDEYHEAYEEAMEFLGQAKGNT